MSPRKYGYLPRQVWEMLPDQYEVLKRHVHISPYIVLAELYGVSRQRIQQVVLQERERQAKQSAKSLPVSPQADSSDEGAAGNQPGPVS